MKLISMTDFVLERMKKDISDMTILDTFKDGAKITNEIFNYANFLNQPIKLEMFVPCDEDGNILKEPKGWKAWIQINGWKSLHTDALERCNVYFQAKERVLFEGFEIVKDKYKSTEREFIYIPNTKIQVWRKLTYHSGKIETFFFDYYDEFKTVENLIKYNLNLTESAIKKLGI